VSSVAGKVTKPLGRAAKKVGGGILGAADLATFGLTGQLIPGLLGGKEEGGGGGGRAEAIEARGQDFALREDMAARRAAAASVTRTGNEADLLGFAKSGARSKRASRALLG